MHAPIGPSCGWRTGRAGASSSGRAPRTRTRFALTWPCSPACRPLRGLPHATQCPGVSGVGRRIWPAPGSMDERHQRGLPAPAARCPGPPIRSTTTFATASHRHTAAREGLWLTWCETSPPCLTPTCAPWLSTSPPSKPTPAAERRGKAVSRVLPGADVRLFQGACGACQHDGDGPALLGSGVALVLCSKLHSDRLDPLIRTILDGVRDPRQAFRGIHACTP